jgi:hypothetical protein
MFAEDFESATKMRHSDVNHREKEEDKVIFLFIANNWISFIKW